MIITRTETIGGLMISRDGALYSEAWDPEGTDRVYEETDTPIEEPKPERTH